MSAKVYHVWICQTCEGFIDPQQIRATADHYNNAGKVCQQENGSPRLYIAYETTQPKREDAS